MQCRSTNTFLRKYHGEIYSTIVRALFAWHYAVKLMFRIAMWTVASGAKRQFWTERVSDAGHFVLDNLRRG
jgi:hypothetical protein